MRDFLRVRPQSAASYASTPASVYDGTETYWTRGTVTVDGSSNVTLRETGYALIDKPKDGDWYETDSTRTDPCVIVDGKLYMHDVYYCAGSEAGLEGTWTNTYVETSVFGTERHETYMVVSADTISVTESSLDEKDVVYDQNEYEMKYTLPGGDTLSYTQNGLSDTMTYVRTGDFLVLDTGRNAFTKE